MHSNLEYFEEDKLGKPYDVKMLLRLYPYTRPYRLLLFLSVFLVILITGIELSIPYLTKIAIDRYIVPRIEDTETLSHSRAGALERNDKNVRYLYFDTDDSEISRIILKYPNKFRIKENSAVILFEDLSKLKKEDLIILRKDELIGVGMITCVFLIFIMFDFIFNFLQVIIMEYTGQMIMHDMRMQLFSHIQSLSLSFFNHNPVGRLVTRVANDVQNMYELFTSVVSFVFKDLFLLTGITVILLTLNWRLAILSFIVLPFVLFASLYFSSRSRDAFRIMRLILAEINTWFSESIGGIKVIQLFNQEENNYRKFAELNHENYLASMKEIKIFAVFLPVIELLGAIATAVVIFYGGKGVLSESITLGVLVAFISYMKMFFNPIRDIAEKYNIMQNAMASAERIFLLLDSSEKLPVLHIGQDKEDLEPFKIQELEMENVSFEYIPEESVLKQISFKIQSGKTIAVVGPTGSGKTSLINLIIRFYDPTSGRVLINGKDIKFSDISLLRSRMALVTQDPFLFSGRIRENIFNTLVSLQKDVIWDSDKMDYILEASNCKSFISRLPKGIDTKLSEGGASISSGERQLISIARAFARDPELIILDEATSYIDSETESKIQDALSNLMQNRTTIIVVHRLSTVRHAGTIIVLNRGRIIESGTHEELIKKKGFYFRLNQV